MNWAAAYLVKSAMEVPDTSQAKELFAQRGQATTTQPMAQTGASASPIAQRLRGTVQSVGRVLTPKRLAIGGGIGAGLLGGGYLLYNLLRGAQQAGSGLAQTRQVPK
jgi:hypothetical protein